MKACMAWFEHNDERTFDCELLDGHEGHHQATLTGSHCQQPSTGPTLVLPAVAATLSWTDQ